MYMKFIDPPQYEYHFPSTAEFQLEKQTGAEVLAIPGLDGMAMNLTGTTTVFNINWQLVTVNDASNGTYSSAISTPFQQMDYLRNVMITSDIARPLTLYIEASETGEASDYQLNFVPKRITFIWDGGSTTIIARLQGYVGEIVI